MHNPFQNRMAYDEISPITNNLCVLTDVDEQTGIISKLCMESGYTTNTLMADTPEFWESLKTHFPIGAEFAKRDSKNTIWIPSAQATVRAALYPARDGNSTDIKWQVTPALATGEIVQEGQQGDYLELDYDATKSFALLEYEKAFNLFAELSQLQTEETPAV